MGDGISEGRAACDADDRLMAAVAARQALAARRHPDAASSWYPTLCAAVTSTATAAVFALQPAPWLVSLGVLTVAFIAGWAAGRYLAEGNADRHRLRIRVAELTLAQIASGASDYRTVLPSRPAAIRAAIRMGPFLSLAKTAEGLGARCGLPEHVRHLCAAAFHEDTGGGDRFCPNGLERDVVRVLDGVGSKVFALVHRRWAGAIFLGGQLLDWHPNRVLDQLVQTVKLLDVLGDDLVARSVFFTLSDDGPEALTTSALMSFAEAAAAVASGGVPVSSLPSPSPR